MPTPERHDCRPIFLPGRVFATCRKHYGQPVGLSESPGGAR